MENIGKNQPQSIEMERSVLGAMLLDKESIPAVLEELKRDSFYLELHRNIFEAAKSIYFNNEPVDISTVYDLLLKQKVFSETDYSYLIEITESVVTTTNIKKYTSIVKEKWLRRELIVKANKMISDAYDESLDFQKVLDNSEKEIFDITQKTVKSDVKHISEFLQEEYTEMSDALESGRKYDDKLISSGIYDLDDKMCGGFNPSDLIIVAARPAMGKTSYTLNLAANIAKMGMPVLVYSLEMSGKQLSQKIVSFESEIPLLYIKSRGLPEELVQNYSKTIVNLNQLPIEINDSCSVNVNTILSQGRKIKSKYKKLGAIVIDYLQLMDLNSDDVTNEVAKITRGLKKVARELNVPVIALSQLSRDVEKRQNKKPQLADLRSSGSIEQDADIVMFLYRDEYYNPDTDKSNIAEVIFAKNRNGEVGSFDLFFDASLTKFTGLEK